MAGHLLLVLGRVDFLLDLRQADMGDSIVAVEDTSDLFERRALGFGVEEVDKDKFDRVPKLGIDILACDMSREYRR